MCAVITLSTHHHSSLATHSHRSSLSSFLFQLTAVNAEQDRSLKKKDKKNKHPKAPSKAPSAKQGKGSTIINTSQPSAAPSTEAPTASPDPCQSTYDSACRDAFEWCSSADCYTHMVSCCISLPTLSPLCTKAEAFYSSACPIGR